MNDALRRNGAAALSDWYRVHNRPLPWRQSPTPYRVWVSEIMLQQTRIEAVLPYYERFMARLPDVPSLAEAPEDVLLKLWEGLGYYSRVRNMQRAAQLLCRDYGGELPADYDALLALPGIGDYTAGAIASIAFGIPVPAVDGNGMRVMSRLCCDETDVLSSGAKKHYAALFREMLPADEPGRFNQAVMELGETVCLPGASPQCAQCPLRFLCAAYAAGRQGELPVRIKRQTRRVEERSVQVVIGEVPGERRVLLHRRPDTGLLAGLWELPNRLSDEVVPLPVQPVSVPTALPTGKHLFSHVEWRMVGELYYCSGLPPLPQGYCWASFAELQREIALPSAFRIYTALLPSLLKGEEYLSGSKK